MIDKSLTHSSSTASAAASLQETDFCVIDVETTGLSPYYNNIIEIGIVKISNVNKKFKITDTYHSLINPGRDIPYFITKFTGISNDDVYNAPFFDNIADEISDFISGNILAGHNFTFDMSFIRKEFRSIGKDEPKNPTLCTLKLAKKLYPTLRSKSLGSVTRHLKLRNPETHRALADAKVTARILIKMLNVLMNNFNIKFADELIDFQKFPINHDKPLKIKKQLNDDVISIPDSPGIYSFLNSKGNVIYIGKAKSLQKRIKSYFAPVAARKARKIVQQASRLKVAVTNSELTALLMEAEAIKLVMPKHNTMLKQYGNKYFLKINLSHPFPTVEICNYFDFDGNDYFGLFMTKKKAEKVKELIDKTFAVRECTDQEFSKGKACFLAEIDRCTIPCVNRNKPLYSDELLKVYEFLYGKSQTALDRLLKKMKEFSDSERYEKASEVKELIDVILSQTHKTSLLAEPVNNAKVLFEVDGGFEKDYVLMLSGKIFIRKYPLNGKDNFDQALDDYFDGTINLDILPTEEDLEKIKITLNWLIKNRNNVHVFYLKDYQTKHELFLKLTQYGHVNYQPTESTFDVKNFINQKNDFIST